MTTFLFFLFIASALSVFIPKQASHILKISLVMGILSALVTIFFFSAPLFSGIHLEISSFLKIDRFSAFIGMLIAVLYLCTMIVSYRYIGIEYHEKILTLRHIRLYFFLLPIFALAMLTVVMADHLGLLWLALETTTLATTPLVALYKKDGSLEAAWKYMIICSIGISLGLLGLLLISYSGLQSGLNGFDALSLTMLNANASHMIPSVMEWAFLFIFIGIGTKVGFFPMQTWLPDAHGRTPSPISAMLSGILLNVAFYSLMRIKFMTDHVLGADQWTNNLFLFFGIISVVTSAFFLYIQHHYKRMLAYSSMEHMGILAIAVGLGPLGLVPALMHMLAHTLSKSLLFFGSGEILLYTKTGKIDRIKNLIKKLPFTGALFILGIFSLLAVPPFATFSSEILLLAALATQKKFLILALLLLSLSLICVSFFKHTFNLFCIDDTVDDSEKYAKEKFNLTHGVMVVQLVLLIVFGIFMLTPNGILFFTDIAQSLF